VQLVDASDEIRPNAGAGFKADGRQLVSGGMMNAANFFARQIIEL
jgi:hypothetical protein